MDLTKVLIPCICHIIFMLGGASSFTKLPKLLLISMDGFRYNYLDLIPVNETKNFQYMINNGVKAKSIMNVFPTVTYPNHYTLITGLYPETHGIVHNRFYDAFWKEYYLYDNARDNVDPFWYDVGAEPIYVTNKKAGNSRNSGSVVWPAGIGKVKGIGPDRVIPYANAFSNISFHVRVDKLIEWFTDEEAPINLGLLYFPEPDEIAHKYGAGSEKVLDFIKGELNEVLDYLFKRLKEVHLLDDINIILTADHGFTNKSSDKTVLLDKYLNASWYKTGAENFGGNGNHMTVNIFPEEGEEENILNALQNVSFLNVYKKGGDELKKLHYSSSERIAPIVLTGSQEGVIIFPDKNSQDSYESFGVHGYDPHIVPNMRPFFIAMGPAFKKGYVSEQFNSVDIYPLMCHILGIEPAPNNGSLDNVKGLLREISVKDTISMTGISFLIVVGLSVTLAGIFAICACHNARKMPRIVFRGKNRSTGVTSLRSPTHHLLNSEDDDDEF
ncbi:ectonucleotide pyrophosphatase/phosphodiesterase family member 5-like [Ruditapes philippinarum]|uniref:ectonucleotide pyrophosphatase/phosphodiesterase family member 5-like n=1 Tax=Ruditapes philippinarum TaxID=129788 RepID=UPI00295BB844|nr:ectonucleotide pyrophosphatase/phosphodiesterase family member 5-like [Ruditapes philippinarum]